MKASFHNKKGIILFAIFTLILSGAILLFFSRTLRMSDMGTAFFLMPRSEEYVNQGTCETLEQGQAQCWEELIKETLQERGIGAALDVVASIYRIRPDCHPYAHMIGEEAYRLFSQGKDMELSPKTYYCGYGFYHAFMETLLHTTGNMEEGRAFCSYADKQLSKQAAGTEAACYHGIGHGSVDGGDPRDWGDIEAMIRPGIQMCKKVAETELQHYVCSTGVFNAIEILSLNPQYKLDVVEEDAFWLCDRQPPRYREACYTNMVPALLRTMQRDFPSMARRIEAIQEKEGDFSVRNLESANHKDDNYTVRFIVISALFHEYAHADFDKAKEGIAVCRSLQDPRSRLPCIEGLSGAFMKYGEPNVEYIKGLKFCSLDMLSQDEQTACFTHILSRLRLWYSSDKAKQICQSVPEGFQALCPDY